MGAFGNYPHNPKPEIDFSQLKTVSVIATFNIEGKIRPDYFRMVNPDQSEETFKIDAIKYTRDIVNPSRIILFCCLYNNYGRQLEVNLVFYVRECRWVIN